MCLEFWQEVRPGDVHFRDISLQAVFEAMDLSGNTAQLENEPSDLSPFGIQ